jgi:hypothetical protein
MTAILLWLALQLPLLVHCGCIDVNHEVLMNKTYAPPQNGNFSFEMWFKLLSPPVAGASVIQFDQNMFSIRFSPSNASVLEARLAGTTLHSDVVLGANEWIHVAARASQTDVMAGQYYLFEFEMAVDGRNKSDLMSPARWGADPVRIRLCSNGMRCLIDYVRMWGSDRFLMADAKLAFQTNAIAALADGNLQIDARFDVEGLDLFIPSLAKNEWVDRCRARHVYAHPRDARAVASNDFPSECEWAQATPDIYQSGMYGSPTTVAENRFLFDATNLFVGFSVKDATKYESNVLTNNADSGEMYFPRATAGLSFDLVITPNFSDVAGGGPTDSVRSRFTATGWLAVARLPWAMFEYAAIGPNATTIDALFCVNDRESSTAPLRQFDHAAARNFMGGFESSRTAWGKLNLLTNVINSCSSTSSLPPSTTQTSSAMLLSSSSSSTSSLSSLLSLSSSSSVLESTSNTTGLPDTTQTLAEETSTAETSSVDGAMIGIGVGIAVAVLIVVIGSVFLVKRLRSKRNPGQTPSATTDVGASSPPNDHYQRAHLQSSNENDRKTYSTLAPHEV